MTHDICISQKWRGGFLEESNLCGRKNIPVRPEGQTRHIWRRNGTAMDPRHLNEVHSSGHVTVNLFGWVWGHGVGELTRVRDRFTGKYTGHYSIHYSLSWQLMQLFGDYLIYLMDFGTHRRPIRWNFRGCSPPHCQGNGAPLSGTGHSASGQ